MNLLEMKQLMRLGLANRADQLLNVKAKNFRDHGRRPRMTCQSDTESLKQVRRVDTVSLQPDAGGTDKEEVLGLNKQEKLTKR